MVVLPIWKQWKNMFLSCFSNSKNVKNTFLGFVHWKVVWELFFKFANDEKSRFWAITGEKKRKTNRKHVFNFLKNENSSQTSLFIVFKFEKQLQNYFVKLAMENSPKTCFVIFQVGKQLRNVFFFIVCKFERQLPNDFSMIKSQKSFFTFFQVEKQLKRNVFHCFQLAKQP